MERRPALALQRDPNVFEQRKVGEHRGDLKRPHQPLTGDVGRTGPGDLLTLVVDAPGGGRQELGQQVEHGGLAGTVRPYKRMPRTLTDPQVAIPTGERADERREGKRGVSKYR